MRKSTEAYLEVLKSLDVLRKELHKDLNTAKSAIKAWDKAWDKARLAEGEETKKAREKHKEEVKQLRDRMEKARSALCAIVNTDADKVYILHREYVDAAESYWLLAAEDEKAEELEKANADRHWALRECWDLINRDLNDIAGVLYNVQDMYISRDSFEGMVQRAEEYLAENPDE